MLLDHYNGVDGKKLLATKKDKNDPDQPLELDASQPVRITDEYKGSDKAGEELVYGVEKLDKKNHGGKTKLAGEAPSAWQKPLKAGWSLILVEDLPNIPRANQGKTLGERTQIEEGKSPIEYLAMLKNNEFYQGEVGMTPEEQIFYAIMHLEKINQVIDDEQGNGSESFQLGVYFKNPVLFLLLTGIIILCRSV